MSGDVEGRNSVLRHGVVVLALGICVMSVWYFTHRFVNASKTARHGVISNAETDLSATAKSSKSASLFDVARQPSSPAMAYQIPSRPIVGIMFRPVDAIDGVVSLALSAGLKHDEVDAVEGAFIELSDDIARIEAEKATIRNTGAGQWFVEIPPYPAEGKAAVQRFLSAVQAKLPEQAASRFIGIYLKDPTMPSVGAMRQEIEVSSDADRITLIAREISPEGTGVRMSQSAFLKTEVPRQLRPLFSKLSL